MPIRPIQLHLTSSEAVSNKLEVPFEFQYTDRMKNKHTDKEVIQACNIVIDELTKLAEFTANYNIERDCNQARLLVKDILLALTENSKDSRIWA